MGNGPALIKTWPAHSDGICRLAYSPDGRQLYTCGGEGYLRVYDASLTQTEVSELRLIDYHAEGVTAVSTSTEFVCTGAESGMVALHRHGETELHSLVTRSQFPIRSARFDPKGKRLAVASDELIVKIVDVFDTSNVCFLTGHKKPVREATWSPDGAHVTTCSADGEIRVWEFSGSEANCLKTVLGVISPGEPESFNCVKAVWHPSAKYFAVADLNNQVTIISRDSWTKIGSFQDKEGHVNPITAIEFSPNGIYFASADKAGNLIIWNTADREIVARTKLGEDAGIVTDLVFHPSAEANVLAFIDSIGSVNKWQDVIPQHLPKPAFVAQTKENSSATLNGNEAEEDFGLEEEDWLDDDIEFGDAAGRSRDADSVTLPARLEAVPSRYDKYATISSRSPAQSAFQPGATPFRHGRRYLAMSTLGLISAVERQDSSSHLVTIEFADRGSRPGSNFTDQEKFSLAALGELGAVFARPQQGEQTSVIHYRAHTSWTSNTNWQYDLNYPESATCVALGDFADPEAPGDLSPLGTGTILVATDKGYIRFLSASGIERYLLNLGAEVIAMSATADWGFIVWRAGGATGLEFGLIDLDNFEMIQTGRLPLLSAVNLRWIGFNSEQIPVLYDSNGVFSLLDCARRPRQARWIPILDTNLLARRENKQESYWTIGMSEKVCHVIILKGEEEFPGFPTPISQELELNLPLMRLGEARGKLEENFLRESLFLSHRRDGLAADDFAGRTALARKEMETDKNLINLMAIACKAENLQVALDCVKLLSQPASFDAATKLANFFELEILSQQILNIRRERQEKPDEGAQNKRESKWKSNVDDRFIAGRPNFKAQPQTNLFAGNSSRNLIPSSLSKFNSTATPSSSAPRKVNRESVRPAADDAMDVAEDEDFQEETWRGQGDETQIDEEIEPNPKRIRPETPDREELQLTPEQEHVVQPKKPINPFSKRVDLPAKSDAASSSPANPFASKKGDAAAAKDLHRTGSFFNRVEGTQPPKSHRGKSNSSANSTAASTKTLPGSKQTTLFGMAPGQPKAVQNKKRKSTADVIEEEETESQPETRLTQLESQEEPEIEIERESEPEVEQTRSPRQRSVSQTVDKENLNLNPVIPVMSKLEKFRRVTETAEEATQ